MAGVSQKKGKKPLHKDLFFQVIVAIVIGVLVGHIWPSTGAQMKPLGDGFINLIKMLIAPIIFCTIVTGVAGMRDIRHVGRVGAKALLLFEIFTTLALIIGLVLVELDKPGVGMIFDSSKYDLNAVREKAGHAELHGFIDFLLNIIPSTLVGAFANGEILQVLLIALLFAASIISLGEKGRPTLVMIENVSIVLFRIVDIVTKAAPIGAFGAMAFTVGKFGIAALKDLGELVILFYFSCAVFIFGVMMPMLKMYCKISPKAFLGYMREELLIVLGTSSSESVLPRLMEKLEFMGCSRPIVGMVVPTGYSFNLIGSCIYFTMGALFITYATDTPITFGQVMTLLGVLLITSKGAAGVTGSAFIVLAATFSSLQLIPQDRLDIGLALIYSVDRFLSTGRAITNLIGNGIITVVIAKWENGLDYNQAQKALAKGYKEPTLPH